ncbi:hypothetical protein GIB67_023711 [Kingdonia uniflora]|uniref:DM2 domain-containing protein n=1 Tax=Kingdonia uniflora TaxID=39325 RepID=A0A7J7MGN9_9MAGN|nr:hypothetical protein GIB67_023711 [Kingdonia uniflora]
MHFLVLEEESGSEFKRQKVEVDSATETTKAKPSPPMVISDALERLIGTGAREMSQSKALCCVWKYIKPNQLEDPLDTIAIICDAKLQKLFGCYSLSSEMVSRLLVPHFQSIVTSRSLCWEDERRERSRVMKGIQHGACGIVSSNKRAISS